jgi:hypothetical protein
MNASPNALDGFEERLLTELRQVVEANPGPATGPGVRPEPGAAPEPQRPRRRPLALAGSIVAAAAAGVAAIVAVGGGGESDAWAVTDNDNGTVTVEIKALNDEDGLERKLHASGVPATVEYEPGVEPCASATLGAPVKKGDGVVPEELGLHEAGRGAPRRGFDQAGKPPAGAPRAGNPSKIPDEVASTGMRVDDDGGVEFTVSKDVPAETNLVITTRTAAAGTAAGPTVEGETISLAFTAHEVPLCKLGDPSE